MNQTPHCGATIGQATSCFISALLKSYLLVIDEQPYLDAKELQKPAKQDAAAEKGV
jgi:hypothetical protein